MPPRDDEDLLIKHFDMQIGDLKEDMKEIKSMIRDHLESCSTMMQGYGKEVQGIMLQHTAFKSKVHGALIIIGFIVTVLGLDRLVKAIAGG